MMDFKKLIFVTGKGGVGKTTISLKIATYLAQQGKKVLATELYERSSMVALAQLNLVPKYQPSSTEYGFDMAFLSGKDCLVEYVTSLIRLEKLVQPIFASRLMQSLIELAPGLKDLAILGKLTSHLRQHGPSFEYDHIIVDAHSTGDFLSFLQAPTWLGQSVSSGPLKTQSESIHRVLTNPQMVQYIMVTLPEVLPVDELLESESRLNKLLKSPTQVVVNKWLSLAHHPERNKSQWDQFVEMRKKEQSEQAQRLAVVWPEYWVAPMITTELKQNLEQSAGDFLRTTYRT